MEKVLPKGWVEVKLGEILKLKNGYAFKSKDYLNEGIPVIRISDIQQGTITFKKAVRVKPNNIPTDFLLEKGDVLVAMSGATTGKYGIFLEDKPALQNQRVGNLKPHSKQHTDKKYIYYLVGALRKEIEDKAYGGAQPNISAKLIEEITCGLPPLAEQKRIVKKLDELFGHLGKVEDLLSKVPQLLKDFRQSVLTMAVSGKLTEENNVDKWLKVKMKSLVVSIKAGKNFRCPEIPVQKGEVGLVKISAVTWGRFNEKETKTVKNEALINPSLFIKKGDFLISRANTIELVGTSVIVDKIENNIMLSDKVWRVKFKDDRTKHYINYFLKSKKGRFEIESRASGNQISMRNLSQKKFLDINLQYPPPTEQAEIVRQVEYLFQIADGIEAQYEVLKAKVEVLPQAILAKAFRGELVEQLDTDGDARALLEEIRKMKAALKPKKKSRRKK